MDNIKVKEQAIKRIKVKTLSQFIILSSVAMFVPFYIHLQWLTGSLVNAILIIALFLVGVRSALVLCMIPSMMALSGGLLPAVLAPAIPFIMFSNAVLILTIDYFYNNIKSKFIGFWTGAVVGSFLKFSFLYFSINIVSGLIIKQEVASRIVQIFSVAQLLTALVGSVFAFLFLKLVKKISF